MKSLLDRTKESEDKNVYQYRHTGDLMIIDVSGDVSEVETSKMLMLEIMDMTFSEIMENVDFIGIL